MKKAGTVRFSLLLSWPPLRWKAPSSTSSTRAAPAVSWPPLRGGSARRRWGRELHLYPKFNLYSAVFVSAINSPGIRQSDDSPTMMNTVRDSQLMLPPSSHPTALNPQMP